MALCSDGGNIQKYSRPLTVFSSVVRDHVVVVEDIYVMLCLHQNDTNVSCKGWVP